jgi:ribosome-associated protein
MARRAAPHRGIDTEQADPDAPSKTRLKEQSTALQVLGRELTDLSADRLAATEMSESLRDALLTYQRTRSHEGRRRQMQYIGKLMRGADEAPLREAVAAATLGSARETLCLHETERWREALVGDDEALTRWISSHPECDAQHLRSLVRAARRDASGLTPEHTKPRSFRELFQFLRPLVSQDLG